jgi:hypothetical protein
MDALGEVERVDKKMKGFLADPNAMLFICPKTSLYGVETSGVRVLSSAEIRGAIEESTKAVDSIGRVILALEWNELHVLIEEIFDSGSGQRPGAGQPPASDRGNRWSIKHRIVALVTVLAVLLVVIFARWRFVSDDGLPPPLTPIHVNRIESASVPSQEDDVVELVLSDRWPFSNQSMPIAVRDAAGYRAVGLAMSLGRAGASFRVAVMPTSEHIRGSIGTRMVWAFDPRATPNQVHGWRMPAAILRGDPPSEFPFSDPGQATYYLMGDANDPPRSGDLGVAYSWSFDASEENGLHMGPTRADYVLLDSVRVHSSTGSTSTSTVPFARAISVEKCRNKRAGFVADGPFAGVVVLVGSFESETARAIRVRILEERTVSWCLEFYATNGTEEERRAYRSFLYRARARGWYQGTLPEWNASAKGSPPHGGERIFF